MLRVKELNISMDELHYFDLSDIFDMLIEQGNDYEEWELKPTQADMDFFAR